MSKHVHNTYNMSGLSKRDHELLQDDADACRLEEIRDWLHRLEHSHNGGYALVDVSVPVVIDYVSWLLAQLDKMRGLE